MVNLLDGATSSFFNDQIDRKLKLENVEIRVVFEVFADKVPKTAEKCVLLLIYKKEYSVLILTLRMFLCFLEIDSFRALCTGSAGVSKKSGAQLHYKGTKLLDPFNPKPLAFTQ